MKSIEIKQEMVNKSKLITTTDLSKVYIKNKQSGLVLDMKGEGGAGNNVRILFFYTLCYKYILRLSKRTSMVKIASCGIFFMNGVLAK